MDANKIIVQCDRSKQFAKAGVVYSSILLIRLERELTEVVYSVLNPSKIVKF